MKDLEPYLFIGDGEQRMVWEKKPELRKMHSAGPGSPRTMKSEVLGEDALLQKLKDSRRRFQRRMQQLMEKYNQPFEDAPVVQMSTLTYETPQGLRIWGGRLLKERSTGQMQGSPEETSSRKDQPVQVTAGGLEHPWSCTQVEDSKSSDVDTTLYQEDVIAGNLTPAVPWSPLKNELRKKYLTQVDALLQDEGRSGVRCLPERSLTEADRGLETSFALISVRRFRRGKGLACDPGPFAGLARQACPPEGDASPLCPADLAVVPTSDSPPSHGTGASSFSSSQCFEADDICNATLSDLYAGMLHSMSRLLGARPSCVITTKTPTAQQPSRHGAQGGDRLGQLQWEWFGNPTFTCSGDNQRLSC
ncbi:Holliday junction recognition protein [Camelus dromedarius]|uniref:Holliday junction recognition protein n=1 Tax=Camelus dromedarius TaxID=9838 RepID=A0A5N4E5F5_CAMDR|nr:Holliday junction recognition protein [Camelus dromedarius]